jgi:hypothetical protein
MRRFSAMEGVMAAQARTRFGNFADFYPFYLSEHANRTSRRLHFVGTSLGLAFLLHAIATLNPWWLLAALVCGYAFAWVGHFSSRRIARRPSRTPSTASWETG